MKEILERLRRVNGFYYAFGLLLVVNGVLSRSFFTPFNVSLLLLSASSLLLLAAGLTLVILTGRIDISVGSIMLLSGGLCVVLGEHGVPTSEAIAAALCSGVVVGALNGVLIAYVGLSALLTTLGMMLAVRGLGLRIIGGQQHYLPEGAEALRQVQVLGIPLYVIIAFLLVALLQWVLVSTFLGRRLVAIGCSDISANKLGIPVRRYVFGAYSAAGLLAAMAGIVSIMNLGGVQAYLGKGQEFVAIAAIVIGGVSLFGGVGNLVPGVLVGVFLLVVVENGLNLAGVSPFAFPFVTGAVILLAMYSYTLSSGRRSQAG
jgi:ribose/xylose/arabinose/galactoside ABC-type transport system permease subunit